MATEMWETADVDIDVFRFSVLPSSSQFKGDQQSTGFVLQWFNKEIELLHLFCYSFQKGLGLGFLIFSFSIYVE